MSNSRTRKETFTFEQGDYTPGSWNTLVFTKSLGKSGDIHRVVLSQSSLDEDGNAAVGGDMDTRIVNGYYRPLSDGTTFTGGDVPDRDVVWEDLATAMVPDDLVASADTNVIGDSLGALYSAVQTRQDRVGSDLRRSSSEIVGVSIKPVAGVTGTIYVTVYASVNS